MFKGIHKGIKDTCSKSLYDDTMTTYKGDVDKDAESDRDPNTKQAKTVIGTIAGDDLPEDTTDAGKAKKTKETCELWWGTMLTWGKIE